MPTGFFTPDTFDFFARYLLAGFIMLSVRSRVVATQRPKPSEVLLDAVVLSLINQAVFLMLLSLARLITEQESDSLLLDRGVVGLFFVEILVLPALLGWAFGRMSGSSWGGGFLRKLSMPGTHPISRAYDFAFLQQNGPRFVIVTYEDGVVIYGYFGVQSLAATDAERSDLYLEHLYTFSDEGWKIAQPPRAALISLANVRSIEFLTPGETGNEQTSAN
jgi:hypothetical protein